MFVRGNILKRNKNFQDKKIIISTFNIGSINFQFNGYALIGFMPVKVNSYAAIRATFFTFLIATFITVTFIMVTSLFKVWFIVMK